MSPNVKLKSRILQTIRVSFSFDYQRTLSLLPNQFNTTMIIIFIIIFIVSGIFIILYRFETITIRHLGLIALQPKSMLPFFETYSAMKVIGKVSLLSSSEKGHLLTLTFTRNRQRRN